MKIRDKAIGQSVEVAAKECPACSCYWPRPDPGSFTQGQGYRSRPGPRQWICGTREAHGCPYRLACPSCGTMHPEHVALCRECRSPLKP